MKIKAEKDFRDRHTKKMIKAGTEVEADQERVRLLDKHGIQYEVVSEIATSPKTQSTAVKSKPATKTAKKADKETR